MKDAVATMGRVLPDDVSGRDAVHVAVISAVSEDKVFPGQHVGLETPEEAGDTGDDVAVNPYTDPIGIVDPFLPGVVLPGCRFWLFLYPRTITGLQHIWTHPAFPEALPLLRPQAVEAPHYRPAEKLASEQWLRDFCARSDCPGYETVLAAAARVADGEVVGFSEEYLHFDGTDAHGDLPPEFWNHIEVVLGRKIQGKRATQFSCAC